MKNSMVPVTTNQLALSENRLALNPLIHHDMKVAEFYGLW
jgi:hypothetical protein